MKLIELEDREYKMYWKYYLTAKYMTFETHPSIVTLKAYYNTVVRKTKP